MAAGLDNTPGVNCTNGSTNVWNQTFSYDAFGNLTKSTSGPGASWMPGYNTANNHYILAGTSYDNNGNLINDTFHTYTWLADGHVATVDLTDGTPGSGSVAISSPTGGEQSKGSPAHSGMGSVTITGTEGLFIPCPRCSPIWDSGTVKITANGHTDQISYAHGDSATTVANNLAGQIRNNSPYIDYTSIITNSPTSLTINLVARTAGASTNYALSATSSSNDPTHFNPPSFTTSTSGATLTGGTDSTLVYDSGTCTVTVNGTPYAKNFGQGDTTGTIASGLASVINHDNVVSATPTLSLTAKAGGPSTNYSLSASCSYDSSNFSGPSFTAAASGSTLTGGTNGPNVGSITYDAMGNKVEENVNGTIHEYVSAFGVSAQMTGQTQNSTLVDLPGGVQALYSGGALQRFRFPDWQGTIRAESDPINRVFTESLAFAPFGERYAVKGTPYNVDSFTGKPDQLVSDEYDFPARQQHSGQGRWISPDPMRGTGNKYVYANNNPLSTVDLYGLWGYQYNPENNPSTGDETEGAVGIEWAEAESHGPETVQTGPGAQVNPLVCSNSTCGDQAPGQTTLFQLPPCQSCEDEIKAGFLQALRSAWNKFLEVISGSTPQATEVTPAQVITDSNNAIWDKHSVFQVPTKAFKVLDIIDITGATPPGTVGGRRYKNDGRGGTQVLPPTDSYGQPIKYREWDVNPKVPGVDRGGERIVTGSDGRAYYTNDHYYNFTEMR